MISGARDIRRRTLYLNIFTLIELLIVIAMIAILLHSKSGFFMANYGRSAF